MIDKYKAIIPSTHDGQAMPSEAEMMQEIIKKFQVPEALIGLHDGMIIESNLAQEKKEEQKHGEIV